MRASGSNRFICPHNAGNSAQQQALPSSIEMSPSSSLETSPFLSSVQGREAWTNLPLRARSVCYHAQRKRSSRSYQHEHGGPHAFDIAYAQMRCDCANKVDHETNGCRDAHPWRPDAKNEAQRTGKLTSREEREEPQRYPDHFLDHMNDLRVSANLGDCRERRHGREEDSDEQICGIHAKRSDGVSRIGVRAMLALTAVPLSMKLLRAPR